jgi:hypothetical protein
MQRVYSGAMEISFQQEPINMYQDGIRKGILHVAEGINQLVAQAEQYEQIKEEEEEEENE